MGFKDRLKNLRQKITESNDNLKKRREKKRVGYGNDKEYDAYVKAKQEEKLRIMKQKGKEAAKRETTRGLGRKEFVKKLNRVGEFLELDGGMSRGRDRNYRKTHRRKHSKNYDRRDNRRDRRDRPSRRDDRERFTIM